MKKEMETKKEFILNYAKENGISNYNKEYNDYKEVIDDIISVIDEDFVPQNKYDVDYWYIFIKECC